MLAPSLSPLGIVMEPDVCEWWWLLRSEAAESLRLKLLQSISGSSSLAKNPKHCHAHIIIMSLLQLAETDDR
uniref:Secreted protein n=1 Tax=Syphacia muris TaxID=451379 RepID=A0A0N5A9P1_9BILA